MILKSIFFFFFLKVNAHTGIIFVNIQNHLLMVVVIQSGDFSVAAHCIRSFSTTVKEYDT